MTNKKLYVGIIPSDSQIGSGGSSKSRNVTEGILGSDTGSVEPVSTQPPDVSLSAEYRGNYSEKMVAELVELSRGSIDLLPYYATGPSTSPDDGYYTTANASSSRKDPRIGEINTFSVDLTRAGTKASHWRQTSIKTSPGCLWWIPGIRNTKCFFPR